MSTNNHYAVLILFIIACMLGTRAQRTNCCATSVENGRCYKLQAKRSTKHKLLNCDRMGLLGLNFGWGMGNRLSVMDNNTMNVRI